MSNYLIQSEQRRMLSLIKADPSVERVFLFGSAVEPNRLHEESDIDLCIVQKTDLPFYDRLAEWINRIQPEVGIDLVVYTCQEFEEMVSNNHFVRSEIAGKGKEVYHAA
jgi:predicted nucleotidyltransferase